MKTHALKSWPEYYWPVRSGIKTFEIRRNDRDFKVGDVLDLHEFKMDGKEPFTGQQCRVCVTYITSFHQADGFVVMAIVPVHEP